MDDPNPDIVFLTLEQVIVLHEQGIKQFTPQESLIVLNHDALDSAVKTPGQTWGGAFLYGSLAEMAAAYLIGLACNHAFENGNKRVALSSCSTFLRMNGYRMTLTQDEAERLVLQVVTHGIEREEVVNILNEAIEAL